MELHNLFSLGCTVCAAPLTSKKKILEAITDLAVKHHPHLEYHKVLDSLLCREKLGSTGIGNGIALPHGRLDDLDKVIAIVITTQKPVEFEAIDSKPVDIYCALLVPENECKAHLSTLAMIAQTLSQKEKLKQIRHAKNNKELLTALTEK